MELACNTYSLRTLSRDAAFRRLRELDLTTVELWAGHAPYLGPAVGPRDVRRDAEAHGLDLRAYCVGGLFGLATTVARDRLERALAFAVELDIPLVTAIVDRAFVPTVDALAMCTGVRVALENHWYTELARPSDVLGALAGCSPAVGAALDTGHFAFLGYDLGDVAWALGARTLHVHLKVVRVPGRLARLVRRARRRHRMEPDVPHDGDGLGRLVALLAQEGYDGLLAIEHEGDASALVRYRERGRTLVAPYAKRPASAVEALHA